MKFGFQIPQNRALTNPVLLPLLCAPRGRCLTSPLLQPGLPDWLSFIVF